jgi:hypothetical protein
LWSRRLAGRQPKAREEDFPVFEIEDVPGVCHHNRDDGAQPLDNRSRFIEPPHIGIAGSEKAIRVREAWIILDREQQLRSPDRSAR